MNKRDGNVGFVPPCVPGLPWTHANDLEPTSACLFIPFYAEDRLLRKKVLESRVPSGPSPTWGQEVTVKMQCVLEDRTVVEKDSKLVFVIGEGDVNQVNTNCYASIL